MPTWSELRNMTKALATELEDLDAVFNRLEAMGLRDDMMEIKDGIAAMFILALAEIVKNLRQFRKGMELVEIHLGVKDYPATLLGRTLRGRYR
ncbi:MAG: hypothetical protein RMK89_13880 [Armatimonadota bacterium]|nr:hypothetical protein [Armatimonadota bacterium]MDW8144535.1 hypothetical protein [Armatimonadota bacterium]